MKEERCIYNGSNVLRDVYAKPGIYVIIFLLFFEQRKVLWVRYAFLNCEICFPAEEPISASGELYSTYQVNELIKS